MESLTKWSLEIAEFVNRDLGVGAALPVRIADGKGVAGDLLRTLRFLRRRLLLAVARLQGGDGLQHACARGVLHIRVDIDRFCLGRGRRSRWLNNDSTVRGKADDADDDAEDKPGGCDPTWRGTRRGPSGSSYRRLK